MLSAIGSSASSTPADTGQSAFALQAQLDRYQQQLSDCVNCSSAKTSTGQQTIQNLSNKIGAIKARINEITTTKSNTQPAMPNISTSIGSIVNKNNLPPNLGQNINVTA